VRPSVAAQGDSKLSDVTGLNYTSLFTKMVVKKKKEKIHTYKNIQQTETETKIKNKHYAQYAQRLIWACL